MRFPALVLLAFAASVALAADPPKPAPAAAFPAARLPGASLEEVLKAFPSARETEERCLHEAVAKARIFCTRFTARQGNLGYHLELSKAGRLIRSTEYVILPNAAEAERVYRSRVAALTKAMGKGKESKAAPSAGLTELRTSWVDKPAKLQRSGVILLTKANEPAMVLDYLETHDPKQF